MASETTANATVLSTDFSDWQKKKIQTDEIKKRFAKLAIWNENRQMACGFLSPRTSNAENNELEIPLTKDP